MLGEAKKITLSTFTQTTVVNPSHVDLTQDNLSEQTRYQFKPVTRTVFQYDRTLGTREIEETIQFNLYPIVVDYRGIPWAEANVYLLDRIRNSLKVVMATYSVIASDLAAYRYFLDETNINWTVFDKNKLYRPTYRYRAYLRGLIEAEAIGFLTARRRMGNIITFYRWLQSEGVLKSEYPMWKNSDHYIEKNNQYGGLTTKHIKSTDISIKVPNSKNPYADTIEDSGKLRPLPRDEQSSLFNVLFASQNTEMILIHLLGIATGARLQTILTMKLQHIITDMAESDLTEIKIPAGLSTGIDTKDDKKIVIHIPFWLYQKLQIYAMSERAQKRRAKSSLGNSDDQYLFLTNRGRPYYESKSDLQNFDPDLELHHVKNGQGVRVFIREWMIPHIRAESDKPKFHYQFHDLRATYGMNLTDEQLEYVARGEISLHQAREFVRVRMCHESSATTDLYLQYRQNLEHIRKVTSAYNDHLCEIVKKFELRH